MQTLLPPLLPPNATALERILDQIEAERIEAIRIEATALIRALMRPDACPEAFLPYLAYLLGITQWNDAWPEAIRRAKTKNAIAIRRHAGTAQAVDDVVGNYGGSARVVEWWETTPPGAPYTFAITITLGGQAAAPSADMLAAMMADVDRAKPARAHYTLSQTSAFAAQLTLRAAARAAIYRRL